MNKYFLDTTTEFDRSYKKLVKHNKQLEQKIISAFKDLRSKPLSPNLKTHKVNTRNYGLRYSSRVTGDIRIIWDFVNNQTTILALDIGGHSGGRRVYR